MKKLVECVRKLKNAEITTYIMRLELSNLKSKLEFIDVPTLRSALRNAQTVYESELDVLASLLQMFTPAHFRMGGVDVDRTMGRQLQDVMNARAEKEGAYDRWWRGSKRAKDLENLIKNAEEELTNLEAVEQLIREDLHAPVVEMAQVWTRSKLRANSV